MTPDNYIPARAATQTVLIGKEAAIALYESNWWEGRSHRDIAGFCLTVRELCCPFEVLQEAVEKSLGRPVFTHEYALNYQGILNEYHGTENAPSLEQIINLVPEEKRVVIFASTEDSE